MDEESKKMILDVNTWPAWPTLPLRRGGAKGVDEELGFLYAAVEPWKKVYLGNIYTIAMLKTSFSQIPSKEYATFEDLDKDGWIVD